MARSLRFKIYNPEGVYVASARWPEEAAVVVAFLGAGATIRNGHRELVWTEGQDGSAAESYDTTAAIVFARCNAEGERS